jgi:hypothetical protein
VNRLLVTGNDKGEVCIFTKNLYSLKHLIRLNMAIKNNIINSIEDIKVLDDERILLYSSQLTIFEIDINEGVILRHYILPSENPSILIPFEYSGCNKVLGINKTIQPNCFSCLM